MSISGRQVQMGETSPTQENVNSKYQTTKQEQMTHTWIPSFSLMNIQVDSAIPLIHINFLGG